MGLLSSVSNHALLTEDVTTRWRERRRSENPSLLQLPWPFAFLDPSLRVLTIHPDSIVVPGLTGMESRHFKEIEPSYLTFEDAHAHLLEYGFKMSLNLEDCTSADGLLLAAS